MHTPCCSARLLYIYSTTCSKFASFPHWAGDFMRVRSTASVQPCGLAAEHGMLAFKLAAMCRSATRQCLHARGLQQKCVCLHTQHATRKQITDLCDFGLACMYLQVAAELKLLRRKLKDQLQLKPRQHALNGTIPSPRSAQALVIETARIPILRATSNSDIKFDISLNDMSGPKAAMYLRQQVRRGSSSQALGGSRPCCRTGA